MADLRPRGHGLATRVLLLAAIGTLLPAAVLGVVCAAAVAGLERRILEERAGLARSLAVSLEDTLRAEVEVLSGIPPGAEGPAAIRGALARTRLLSSVSLYDAGHHLLLEEPVGTATGARVHLLVPLRDRESRLFGFAGARLDPSSRALGVLLASPGRGVAVDVLDRDGVVLLSSRAPRTRPRHPVRTYAPLPVWGWGVSLEQERDELFAASALLVQRALVLGPLVLAAALLFAWGAARSVQRPLATLTEAAERIAGGVLDQAIPALPEDEVGRLGRALEAMRAALERSIFGLEARVRARTDELSAVAARLKEREERLRRLLSKLITAQEDERKRIARELHDETCQTVSALALSLPEEPGAGEARRLAHRALDGLHRLIFDLRPSVLDDLGLLPAIRWWATRHLPSAGIAVRCELEESERRLSPETEIAVFRVAQEALVNVVRHSGASAVLIQMAGRDGHLEASIEDDGRGFDPGEMAEPTAAGRGLGLLGMRERVELLGGQLEVESAPGQGTRVSFRVPFA